MFDTARLDVRFAARSFARSPLFVLVSVLSIAIGVGATTAIVTLANALLLRDPPGVGHAGRLVTIGRSQDGQGFDNFSYPNFVDLRGAATTLSGVSAIRGDAQLVSLTGPTGGEPVQATIVSGNFFDVLETRAALGRLFTDGDDRAGSANAVVVLTHRFWRSRFAGDTTLVGRTITLNGTPFMVVGVAQEGFEGPFVLTADLWVPVMASPLLGRSPSLLTDRAAVWMVAIGRLAPGATLSQARMQLALIGRQLAQQYSAENRGKGFKVTSMSLVPGDAYATASGFLGMLFAVAALVLLIASTNVAGMMLARAADRQREVAVRLSLGASRRRLVGQLVTESLMLFTVGGLSGVLLASWLVAGLVSLIPHLPVQLALDPSIDGHVLAYALGVSLVAGVLAGLAPALQSTRPSLVPALKSDARTPERLRLRSSLLVAQIAFSTLLLIVAGLFGRALVHARAIDPGFDPRGLTVTALDLRLANYDSARGRAVMQTLLDRVRHLPTVQSATFTAAIPLGGNGMGMGPLDVPGHPAPNPRDGWRVDWSVVTPGYFATMALPLLRGRDFTDADRSGGGDVVILNEIFANALWPGEDAVGRVIQSDDRRLTVIGIAHNAKYRSLGESPRNFIYVPIAQWYNGRTHLVVRSTNPIAILNDIRRAVAAVDPALPVIDQQTFEEQTALSLFPQRVALYVAGSLGVVALLLALLGIYGVTAFNVAQRTREMGIRIALGADPRRILHQVLKHGVGLASIGLSIGVVLAAGVTRLISALLYGVQPDDASAFVGATLLLALAALAASWIPARRAARLDPVVALRSE